MPKRFIYGTTPEDFGFAMDMVLAESDQFASGSMGFGSGGTTFSASLWWKLPTTDSRRLLVVAGNTITLGVQPGANTLTLTMGSDKDFTYHTVGTITSGVWYHTVYTFDSDTETTTRGDGLKLYHNGILRLPTGDTAEVGGTSTWTGPKIGELSGPSPPASVLFKVGPNGYWDVAHTAANVSAIFAGKFGIDLTVNSGGYTNSSTLEHYYRASNADPGITDRVGNNNLDDGDIVATQSDVVADAP